jgi:NTP pyrophosphatase (non-canonical NTP hydrolase)
MKYVKDGIGLSDVESRLKAVVCGSFRRDPAALEREFHQLQEAGCTVLSPLDLDFVSEVEGFVYGQTDLGRSSAEIEQAHLRAMQAADFVWLHCPGGYVGTSAAMELGFVQALGLRVFAAEPPENVAMRDLVQVCDSPAAAAELSRTRADAPSRALVSLQGYYARVAHERGWEGETPATTVGLLRGEVDELESALGDAAGADEDPALELADVLLYVVHLANILGLDLGRAVRDKERINSERFDPVGERLAV